MAKQKKTSIIDFDGMLGQSNPVFTYNNVWGDNSNLKATFTGQVVTDSCAPDSPVIAANATFSGPVFINFNKKVSGITLDAGCFDAVKSTRVTIYGDNGFKVDKVFNPNGDKLYHTFKFNFGENVIKKVAIIPVGNEPAGFAVDNVKISYRPESLPVAKSNNAAIDSLIATGKWADKTIEWSFVKAASDRPGYGTGPQTFGGSANRVNTQDELSAGQKAMVRKSMGLWEDVAQIKFKQVADGDEPGQIRISRAAIGAVADAFYPSDDPQGGDITIRSNRPLGEKQPGDREFTAIVLHEVGHSIGLSHPHESAGEGTAAAAAADSVELSVMSYRSVLGGGLPGIPSDGNHGEGPMMNDIAAIQFLYGANWKHNAGNTTYTFDPTEAKIFRTIWDGGGTDTYDATGYATKVKIDLAPGSWSVLARSQRAVLEANGAGAADDALASGNVANALLYKGKQKSLIENAKGGSSHDKIFGNQAENILAGRDGNDTLRGRNKDDILRGGDGKDKLFGGNGNDLLRGDEGDDQMTGGAGRDLFVFLAASDGGAQERIKDFTKGQDDIVLSTIDADTTKAGKQSFSFIGAAGFSGTAGELRAVKSSGDTLVRGDTNGDGTANFRVTLTGEMTLTAGDFVL